MDQPIAGLLRDLKQRGMLDDTLMRKVLVDDASDAVTESVGEGKDHVHSTRDYTLTANVENLTLTGTAGSTIAIRSSSVRNASPGA